MREGDLPVTGLRRARLAELGLTLYGPHPPHEPLLPTISHAGIVYVSGQLPRIEGRITCLGQLGSTVSVPDAVAAAAVCALNALAVLEESLGSLDRIEQFLRVTGFVASAPNFHEQHLVIDGASKIFHSVFGDVGRHVRSAIGVASLPRGAAVEIELSAAFRR